MYCYYECSVALTHGALFGLQCVVVVFPDHTHLLLDTSKFRRSVIGVDLSITHIPTILLAI